MNRLYVTVSTFGDKHHGDLGVIWSAKLYLDTPGMFPDCMDREIHIHMKPPKHHISEQPYARFTDDIGFPITYDTALETIQEWLREADSITVDCNRTKVNKTFMTR